MRRRNLHLDFGTDSEEFERYVGRRPTAAELEEWVRLLEKGVSWSLDWDVLCSVAAEEFVVERQRLSRR